MHRSMHLPGFDGRNTMCFSTMPYNTKQAYSVSVGSEQYFMPGSKKIQTERAAGEKINFSVMVKSSSSAEGRCLPFKDRQ